MPETYPNQRMIHIHREMPKTDFLGIKNENWQAASRDLGAHALRLYLYLAANANNYTLALSPADIRQTIGMASSTYRDQFLKLVDKGYLIPNSSNGYDFFEVPQARPAPTQRENRAPLGIDFENCTAVGFTQTPDNQTETAEDREINNRDDVINSSINNELYPQRIIRITSPKAEEKEKAPEKLNVPKGEFIF